MFNRRFLVLTTLLFAGFNLYAQDGSDHPVFKDDWLFRIGGQQADADLKAGLANADLGDIPIIDLNASDADTKVTSLFANMIWQAPERWSMGFSYFKAETDSERLLDEDLTFGDLRIPAGTGVTANFTTDFYILNGYWDFYRAPDRAAGIGLGIYGLELDITLAAQIGGQLTGEVESANTLAPLPTISAYYKHAFNANLAILLEGGWLSANIDEYDGEILAARLAVDYWINEHWGLGAGYNYVDVDLTVDKPVFDQLYEVQYDSYFLYATFGF